MDYRKQAYYLKSLGINTCPLKVDGSKLPKIFWKHLQEKMISDQEIEEHCADCGGLAGITGSISELLCIDFDLDKELLSQNYWKRFMSEVPESMKRRFLVNSTRSGGYHVWLRVKHTDKSRKIAHRALTIQELYDRYTKAMLDGLDPDKISRSLLNKPKQCIIETRFEGSYGVISHESYNRIYGTEINYFTKEEVDFLLTIGYSLDFAFKAQKRYVGEVEDFKTIVKYNEDTDASDVLEMILNTGLYEYVGTNYQGDLQLKRVGSNNKYSSVIFTNSGVIHDFGMSNIFNDDKDAHTPFETLCAVNDFSEYEGINYIKENLVN